MNTEIPLKDYLFQHKLLKYCESNNFKKVIDLAYNKSVLEGILVSCNTCFHRYPWNQYITARRAFFQFINQEPYKTILKKKLIIATSIYYREQFYGVQNTISFFWAILFEVELLCIKIKNKKERCLMKKY